MLNFWLNTHTRSRHRRTYRCNSCDNDAFNVLLRASRALPQAENHFLPTRQYQIKTATTCSCVFSGCFCLLSVVGWVKQVCQTSYSRWIPVKWRRYISQRSRWGRLQQGQGCLRAEHETSESDPELVVKAAFFFFVFLDKMCNTFCQEGGVRICIMVVLLCMWSEQCVLPPDRWIRWRCTVEPRGWTSSSSSSSALFPCRWWWRPDPRLSRAHEEPGSAQASICTNEIVFFFFM